MKQLIISAHTLEGNKEENQDSYVIRNNTDTLAKKECFGPVLINLDKDKRIGMGVSDGVSAAKYASLSSDTAMNSIIEAKIVLDEKEQLEIWVNQAHEDVMVMNTNDYEVNGACTLSCLIISDNGVFGANIGDSPIFRIRDGKMQQLAQMQTAAYMKKQLGIEPITESDRHVLMNYIGKRHTTGIDQMHYFESDLVTEDIYLICSDGICDSLDEKEIQSLLQSQSINKAKLLVEAANQNPKDNLTAIVIDVV